MMMVMVMEGKGHTENEREGESMCDSNGNDNSKLGHLMALNLPLLHLIMQLQGLTRAWNVILMCTAR